MPPKKRDRKKLGARPYKNYTDEMMALAIEMVETKRMTSYEAEKTFSIPRRTIEKKVKKKHSDKPGPPFKLSPEEELNFVKVLIVASDYGAPLTQLDLRILVHEYLKKNNRSDIFHDKMPGEWWVKNFIERYRDKLSLRAVQNIKRARAEKTLSEFQQFFNNIKSVLENVPPTHIVNYDETNFSDDPGSAKCIFRRGTKYPERVMNSSKGCISVMFAGTANGSVMPPYVVYKAESLWCQWVEGGPENARFNRTKSGWFDSTTFLDWFNTIIVPWARKLEGPKVVIGDNLSSHINSEVIELCEKYNIRFVLLPPNSTHLTQPLDVAFFGPLKKVWRKILTTYKIENPKQAGLNKSHFPPLLAKVMDEVNMTKKENVVSGFRATGIVPFNPQQVYKKIPECLPDETIFSVDQTLLDYLKENRKPNEIKRGRNKKLNVQPGKSITTSELNQVETDNKKQKKNRLEKEAKTKEDLDLIVSEEGYIPDARMTRKTQIKSKEKTLDTKIDEFSGKLSAIQVKICGNLSGDDISHDEHSIELDEATIDQIKRRKRSLKEKNLQNTKPAKKCKHIGSTTTEDSEYSVHSEIEIYDLEDLDDETDYDVKKRIDIIECRIFDEIAKIEYMENNNDTDKYQIKQNKIETDLEKQNNDEEDQINTEKETANLEDKQEKQDNTENETAEEEQKDTKKKKEMTGNDYTEKETESETKKEKEKNAKNFNDPTEKQKEIENGFETGQQKYTKKKITQNDTETKNYINKNEFLKTKVGESEEKKIKVQKKIENDGVSWAEGDTILARYYSRKWKYFVGIIKHVNRHEKKYSVSYYKITRMKDGILFVMPKKADEDNYLPEDSIVKSVQLLQISEYPEKYVLMNEEDNIYFD
ncbi:uncharacterized protein LOC132904249 [Amyelois transitella]|nr:uncharacterized protein LOC132902713 isoform X2 [Amyelois transitella]XP_060804833.1 uncharacterized protein LOC106142350 isoform X2 [Amyelois transitella]XP_060810157.1 uncharacterized protein LOC132904249 [Amyelois transitella]